jgi:hypothetical protein
MNDQETPPAENVIKGPWLVKSGRKVKLPDKDVVALRQKLQFAEELSESLIVQMIHTMSENGIDISENSFVRDMSMVIELVQGSIYRDLELEHPTHKFMEEFVDIIILPDNTVETEVDFDTINKLANILEEVDDDDDPEIS